MTSDEKAMIALLVAAFLLSKADIKAMAAAILIARIASMKAAYSQASDTVGVDTNWEPPADLRKMAEDVSMQDAESIAATYEAGLSTVAEAFVTGWMAENETLEGCEIAARTELAEWSIARAEWKSTQVADFTCGSGANDGIGMWVANVKDGTFELPDDVTLDDIELTVMPEESSHDECEDFAGETFSLDDFDDIIDFPAHPGCPHHVVVIMKGE